MADPEDINFSVKVQRNKLLDFLTPHMFITVGVLVMILITLRDFLLESYYTNIPLNSVIFIVIVYAIYKAFNNNYKFYTTMVFFKKVEDVEYLGQDISAEEMGELYHALETKGSLVNIQNMHGAIQNLNVYGHLNFSDNDARLIKSKFGARVRHDRGIVNYFAGILVMLGLIGTFYGLLGTISAVGESMGEVSRSFSDGGGEGDINIGEFIASISKPLQGMGTAFSSSLFGLGGSLFLGFLNFFCGQSQNGAIEEVSRWIDNRIPKLNPALQEKIGDKKVPKSDDLKAWLAGFVFLAGKTNQKMGQIMLALTKTTDTMMKSAFQTKKIYDYQKEMFTAMQGMSSDMRMVKNAMTEMAENAAPALRVNTSIRDNLVEMKGLIENGANSNNDISTKQLQQMSQLSSQMQEVDSAFQMLSNVQSKLVVEIEKLEKRTHQENKEVEFGNMVWQLNAILEDIKQQNISTYMNIFEDEEPEDEEKTSESTSPDTLQS